MKKQALLLLFLGALLMGLPVFTRSFMAISDHVGDFMKGMGLVFMLSAAWLYLKKPQPKNS
jgi:glucan phosphoethanolaminetransferase (alkaline phosphatase superfamily)